MDHSLISEPEVARHIGGLAVVRWLAPALPAGLDDLVIEAERAGYTWIAAFRTEWARRPSLSEGEALFIALDGVAPVGMAVIGGNTRADVPVCGRLKHIYVGQAVRGRGLLRPLVELCLARAGSRWPCVTLHTDNPVAARIYESYGFRPTLQHGWSTHVLYTATASGTS